MRNFKSFLYLLICWLFRSWRRKIIAKQMVGFREGGRGPVRRTHSRGKGHTPVSSYSYCQKISEVHFKAINKIGLSQKPARIGVITARRSTRWPLKKRLRLTNFMWFFSFSHLNRLLSHINIVPITNLFPKYHMSKHYRTCVQWDRNNNKKVSK